MSVSPLVDEHGESLAEQIGDLALGRRVGPTGGEFERKRHAVESTAQLTHGIEWCGRVIRVRHVCRSIEEQRLGVTRQLRVRRADRESAEREAHLAGATERDTAGGEDRESWNAFEQVPHGLGGLDMEVLAVVEHQQRLVRAKGGDQVGVGLVGGGVRQAQRSCDRGAETVGVGELGEIGEPRRRGSGWRWRPRLRRRAGSYRHRPAR